MKSQASMLLKRLNRQVTKNRRELKHLRAGMSTKEVIPIKDKDRSLRRMKSELGSSVCISSRSSSPECAIEQNKDLSPIKEKKKKLKDASWKQSSFNLSISVLGTNESASKLDHKKIKKMNSKLNKLKRAPSMKMIQKMKMIRSCSPKKSQFSKNTNHGFKVSKVLSTGNLKKLKSPLQISIQLKKTRVFGKRRL